MLQYLFKLNAVTFVATHKLDLFFCMELLIGLVLVKNSILTWTLIKFKLLPSRTPFRGLIQQNTEEVHNFSNHWNKWQFLPHCYTMFWCFRLFLSKLIFADACDGWPCLWMLTFCSGCWRSTIGEKNDRLACDQPVSKTVWIFVPSPARLFTYSYRK